MVVHLPDLDGRVSDGTASPVEYAAAQARDRSHRRSDGVIDDQQVIVRVERHLVGVERAFGLRRRLNKLFGENARHKEAAAPAAPTALLKKIRRDTFFSFMI